MKRFVVSVSMVLKFGITFFFFSVVLALVFGTHVFKDVLVWPILFFVWQDVLNEGCIN
jgi:ABC-type transport system involved in cytochrome bd biosynthesis fused ATPase/permease subunit